MPKQTHHKEDAALLATQSAHPWLTRRVFEDVDFPLTRDGLIKHFRAEDADPALITRIEDLPDITFHDFDDIAGAFGSLDYPDQRHLNPEDPGEARERRDKEWAEATSRSPDDFEEMEMLPERED